MAGLDPAMATERQMCAVRSDAGRSRKHTACSAAAFLPDPEPRLAVEIRCVRLIDIHPHLCIMVDLRPSRKPRHDVPVADLERHICVRTRILDQMHRTAQRNGVLFYLAVADRKFAIIGDKGINEKVPEGFWDSIRDVMSRHFQKKEFTEGLCLGIEMAGEKLKAHFPYEEGDVNELSDDVSFGK